MDKIIEQEKIIGDLYRVQNRIGQGSFGEVHKGVNVQTGELVAIKMESQDAPMPQVKHEYQILKQVQGQGFPKVYWFGEFEDKTVMVMELLAYNLEELLNMSNRVFCLKTMLMLIDQMIDIVQLLHAKGYIYRDIKPENLLMGANKRFDTVYIIDFGLSKRYKDKKTGDHIAYKENKGLVGTARYVSVNTHLGIEQSRRDDLESLGYMWIYFINGKLPWQGLQNCSREEKYDHIKMMKQSISNADLCKNLPIEFQDYFQHCRSLKFDEEPQYKKMKMMFRDLFFKLDYNWDFSFDWVLVLESDKIRQSNHKNSYMDPNSEKQMNGSQFELEQDQLLQPEEQISFKISAVKKKLDFEVLKSQPNLFQNLFQ